MELTYHGDTEDTEFFLRNKFSVAFLCVSVVIFLPLIAAWRCSRYDVYFTVIWVYTSLAWPSRSVTTKPTT